MYRIYVGNLDPQVTEEVVKQIFADRNLPVENAVLRNGYAFIDCVDQATVDNAIDKLSEVQLFGRTLQVEPALTKQRNSNRLVIRNIPEEMAQEAVDELLNMYGTVKESSRQADTIYVTYSSSEQAQQARDKLADFELQGQGPRLKVDFVNRRARTQMSNYPKQEFPLRLLVPHQFVGAIIGRSGQTIRNITQQTNARVDVVRRDNAMAAEKMVMILAAQLENCIEACKEILKVIHHESATGPRKETELKILAHNNLCGRLIGKQGTIIKSIMEETQTTIAVSSVSSVNPMNQDRVVTIRGNMDGMCAAAEKIYSKLKSCYEADMQSLRFNPASMMYPGVQMAYQPWAMRNPYLPGMLPPPPPMAATMNPQQAAVGGHMTCFLYIPKASVGAVIGSKGSYINFVKQESRASCQVQERLEEPDASDRPVKITGYPECVWKAQWYIFDKVKSEGFTGNEYAKLRCDVLVPKKMVGRIIGKGGQNVRHIQDISDAIIKLPEEQSAEDEEVPVQVIGNIYSQTLAQALIRQLLTQGQMVPQLVGPMRGPPRGAPRSPQTAQRNALVNHSQRAEASPDDD